MVMSWIPLAIALALATAPALAEERKTGATTPITLDESGLPVVSVTLHSLKNANVAKTFRFLLDTGTSACAVDRSVPSEFFWDEPFTDSTTSDQAEQTAATQTVLLKRVEVGRVVRDGILAARLDLKQQLGRFEDQPVDGILGMSFLRGTRFLFDPIAGRIVWWANHFNAGETLPMTDGPEGPTLRLRVGTQETSALIDTGMAGGIDLPKELQPKGEGRTIVSVGLSGVQVASTELVLHRLEAGSSAWVDVPVSFKATGKLGGIGSGVWGSAPACFDFITYHLTLGKDARGNLAIRREPSRSLPIMWDREGDSPRLLVWLVKPGSAMDKAGCKAGDEILEVGDLHGPALTRRRIQELVATGARHEWVVLRNAQKIRLPFNPG